MNHTHNRKKKLVASALAAATAAMATPAVLLAGAGTANAAEATRRDDHPYAMWDAAYLLGSLSAADRREFEAHMANCPACRDAVADLSGVPALLSQLDREEVAAIDESRPALR